ncbi:hypothetical protein [Dactylosporangium sp. NPDC005555]|uniref:hypothetical protein n=1 Tax=Dactylosporangium sp. NPDC005555 TaxID=3154889 RepID=UPI0033B71204
MSFVGCTQRLDATSDVNVVNDGGVGLRWYVRDYAAIEHLDYYCVKDRPFCAKSPETASGLPL